MRNDFRWYDSYWRNRYHQAKDVISRVAPHRLQEFIDSFRILRTDPNFVVKDVPVIFNGVQLAEINRVIQEIPKNTLELHEIKRFGRLVVKDNPAFTKLQRELAATVSDLVGEEVEPRYNFLSLYTRMGICEPHLDAPSAKWTLDVCINQSVPWPIYFSQVVPWPEDRIDLDENWQRDIKRSPQLKFYSKVLTPGSGILFSGSSQWHYRDPLPRRTANDFCDLLFFHYIPKGTSEIVTPGNWASLFGIPEIASITGIEEVC